jgi:hypothetical protein
LRIGPAEARAAYRPGPQPVVVRRGESIASNRERERTGGEFAPEPSVAEHGCLVGVELTALCRALGGRWRGFGALPHGRRERVRWRACGAEGFRINAVGPGAHAARAGRLGRPERLNGVPPGEIAADKDTLGGAKAITSRRTPPPKWPSTFSSDNVPPEHRKMRGRVRRSAGDCGVAR